MSFDKSSKKYIQIADIIMSEINKGTWKEGDAIPTVRVLAIKYNVSPQTANKATTHLAGLGILSSRQGSGSVVTGRKGPSANPDIPMLVDKSRSSYLQGESRALGYHGKELYLDYLHAMSIEGYEPSLIVYDKKDEEVSESTMRILNSAKGVLIQGSISDCYLDYLHEKNIPAVFINRKIQEGSNQRIGSVKMDNNGLEQLSAYITSLGHSKIIYAFSNEFEITSVYADRLKVITESLLHNSRGVIPEVSEFIFTPALNSDAVELKELVEGGFSAILCYNDISALRIYDLLHQKKIRIPEEVSVCGFDDLFMAEIAAPPLTTVKVNRNQLLNDSLSLLKELILDETLHYITRYSKTDLVIRRSCWQHS